MAKTLILEDILACPKCHTKINPRSNKCPKCGFFYFKKDGIWHLLYVKSQKTKESQKEYDQMHKKTFGGPNDGSYEILAGIARGNKTVDIAAGQGEIEKLEPETVAVEFSENALKKAKKNGAKYLVLADAHNLPFVDDAFDISISSGNLEHFLDPQKAIKEMARVSKIQVLTVHRHPPIPFAPQIFDIATAVLGVKHQPIEKPIAEKQMIKMFATAGLHIVFKGFWTLPLNYGRPVKFLPEFKNIPSCYFVISTKI